MAYTQGGAWWQVMVVWASALEQDWVNGTRDVFAEIAASFTPLPTA